MWYTILIIVHVLACVFLTVVVLLQAGKGSDISAVFGGSSQTLFGSSGASTFLSKLTTWTAVVFMATSLTLTYGAAKRSSRSVFDSAPPVSAPAPTEGIPPAQPSASTEGQGATTPSTAAAPPSTGEPTQAKPATPESAPTAQTPAASTTAPATTEQPPSPPAAKPAGK